MTSRRRCAIYTRKSTEEGLEQDFNSLDAQREACSAFIASQRHEGWSELPEFYDDGGFSGGSMERPALVRLLADIEADAIDTVIVYKVDRLTRALADFARMVAVFDAASVSFVSVTQQFNTTTSMGRLTLNVLLSFAQFEREVTAERIRDKIAASKARGMWMGGVPPMGYRPENRSLAVEPEDAATVRHIFNRYLDLSSVRRLQAELDRKTYRTPIRTTKSGKQTGGRSFSKGKLYSMLSNPVYIGKIRHRDKVHEGQHEPIIGAETWDKVQAMLVDNRRSYAARSNSRNPSVLAGKLFDPDGNRMRPVHTTKNGQRYRYYTSPKLIDSSVDVGAAGWRIPGIEIEAAVARVILKHLKEPDTTSDLISNNQNADEVANLTTQLKSAQEALEDAQSNPSRQLLMSIVNRIDLSETELAAQIDLKSVLAAERGNTLECELEPTLKTPIQLKRRGGELKLVLQGAASQTTNPDANLITAVMNARRRFATYTSQENPLTISEIANSAGSSASDISRSMQLAFLAPDLLEAILDGRQPIELTATRLQRIDALPLLWQDQRRLLA
ncbi:recombinase family protein [Rhodobacteraceae bacterium nBUS_24]